MPNQPTKPTFDLATIAANRESPWLWQEHEWRGIFRGRHHEDPEASSGLVSWILWMG